MQDRRALRPTARVRAGVPRAQRCAPRIRLAGSRASRGAELLTPVRIELAQSAHPFTRGWMRHEERRETLLQEWVDRVERLRRRTADEGDELRRLVEPDEGS